MFRKWCLDKCQGSRAFVCEGRTGTWGSNFSRAQIQEAGFRYYLIDSSESWKVFDQVMGNLEQTGFGFFLRSITKPKVGR